MSRFMTGTMTTTLLLAYSAEYTAMLMTFTAVAGGCILHRGNQKTA
jgi:uncharacterized membrane protein